MNFQRSLFRLLMIHRGEGKIVLFLAVLAILAGFGLSVGRASSDALFFKRYGVDHLPLMYALTALVLVPASLAYAAFVDRLMPHRMLIHMLGGFGLMVGISWLAMTVEGNTGIALYFISYGVISELLLAHFELYLVGFFDAQQAKRLLPTVMAISRLGAMMGGIFLGVLGSGMATEHAALIWTGCLAAALVLVAWRHRGESTQCMIKRGHATSPLLMVREGLMFSRQSRLMRITAWGVFLLVLLLSVQEYLVGKIFVQHYPDERKLAAFFGWFSAILNGSVLLIQLFLSGRLFRRLGLRTMNLVYPVTTLLSFGLMTISASYLAAIMGRVNTSGVLPCFRNTAAGFFFHALPTYMQGRTRALITGLVLPSGLLGAALFLWLVPKEAPMEWVAGSGLVFAVALFWVKLKKNDAYAESLVELVGQSVFTADTNNAAQLGSLDRATAFRLAGYLRQTGSSALMNNYADMLELLAHEHAGAAILDAYPDLPPKFQDQLLLRLARLAPPGWAAVAWEASMRGDPHLFETTARVLLAADYPDAIEHVSEWMETGNPRLQSAAAVGCLHGHAATLKPRARAMLATLLASSNQGDYLAAMGALAAMPHEDMLPAVRPMLICEDARARAYALDIWSRYAKNEQDGSTDIINWAMGNASAEVRASAIQAAARLQATTQTARVRWLERALHDPDYQVRQAGRACARFFLPDDKEGWMKVLEQSNTDFDLQAVMVSELADSDIKDKDRILCQVSERHVQLARDKLMIRENLPLQDEASNHTLQLLQQVLREEARRHLDTVLHILGCLDRSIRMSYIRAGLASRDRRLWAQSIETAMQLKKNGPLFRTLAVLYEAEREGALLGGEPPGGKAALSTWLEWCQEFGSEWLAECARYCLGSKGLAS